MISVSYLKSKFEKLETIKKIDESIADMIHVDLIDGIYCGNKNFDIDETINFLKDTKKLKDVHLMVLNPERYIDRLSEIKPYIISVHLNTTDNIISVFQQIKSYNIKVGLAINPEEDIKIIDKYLDYIDYVLIMSVHPGMGGQVFIEDVLEKINYLENKGLLVGIDGGINENSIKLLNGYRINNIVSGSFVCMNDDYNKQISILKY